VRLDLNDRDISALDAQEWETILIASKVELGLLEPSTTPAEEGPDASATVTLAPGQKCERCWRVLAEVHPATALCRRCDAVVSA